MIRNRTVVDHHTKKVVLAGSLVIAIPRVEDLIANVHFLSDQLAGFCGAVMNAVPAFRLGESENGGTVLEE